MIDRLHEPPDFAHRFRSDDLDEVRAFMDRHNGAHWRRAHGRGPVGFDAAVLGGQDAALGWVSGRLPQTVRGRVCGWAVHLPLEGAITYRFGRRERRAVPGTAILIAPRRDLTVALPAGRVLAIRIDEASLAREAAARHLKIEDRCPPVVEAFPLQPGLARALAEAFEDFVRPLFSTDGHSAPAVTPSCARLVEWIVDRLESRLPQEPASTAATARVRDVEDWIEAHLHEPITLGRLCEAAGVGARSLQLAFEARRHATPMEFVMERRLAAAHARLVADRGESSVTSVAASVGMEHLGRFAASYRRFYGEPPSATLRRRLPQAAAEGLHGDGAGVSQR